MQAIYLPKMEHVLTFTPLCLVDSLYMLQQSYRLDQKIILINYILFGLSRTDLKNHAQRLRSLHLVIHKVVIGSSL